MKIVISAVKGGVNHGIVIADKESGDLWAHTLVAPVSNSKVVNDLVLTAHGSHVQVNEAESGPGEGKKQPKWTRLVRMECGPVEQLKEGAKSILGKRSVQPVNEDEMVYSQHSEAKRGKVDDESTIFEAAGVLQHPCRAEALKLELPRAWEPLDSSKPSQTSEGTSSRRVFLDGDTIG